MQVDLNQDEIQTLMSALKVWQNEAQSGALIGSLITAMVSKNELEAKEKVKQEMDAANMEGKVREQTSIMLQAKLLTAMHKSTASFA